MFLQDGLQLRASAQHISLYEPGAQKPLFRFEPQHQDRTTFTLMAEAGENIQNIYVNVVGGAHGMRAEGGTSRVGRAAARAEGAMGTVRRDERKVERRGQAYEQRR